VYGVIGASNEGTVQADFSLDDGFTSSFNPPSPSTVVAFGQLMFSANNLRPAQHKITGISKAKASFIIDYILVEPGFSTESAKPASPSDTASSEPPTSRSITPGAIAGIVIGCLVGVATIVMVYWLVKRRKRAESSTDGSSGTSKGSLCYRR
jgi:hypothetical protein